MHSPDFLFPRFLVFPPANPSNFHIANVFLSGFPFFSVQKYYLYVQNEMHKWNVKKQYRS